MIFDQAGGVKKALKNSSKFVRACFRYFFTSPAKIYGG